LSVNDMQRRSWSSCRADEETAVKRFDSRAMTGWVLVLSAIDEGCRNLR
jgi:hypothetical protein